VPTLLEAAVAQARPNADATSVRLVWRAAEGLPVVRADRHRILQVVSNLLVNTIKFAASGAEIQLSAEPFEGMVRISVCGTSLGMDQETAAHLFDRFWQSKDARYRALGLGLYVAKNVVEAHGGTVEVEQQPTSDRGCVFHLTLPKSS
jgi:signal transduction histidine kinase